MRIPTTRAHGHYAKSAGERRPLRDTRCMNSAPVLDARGLQKRFGDIQAVAGIDLAVAPGERVALLGPNGAGKTTTLLMLLGVIEPDEGSVTICGHPLARARSAAMSHVGFAAGYLPLPDSLTVVEVLEMFGDLYGVADPHATAAEAVARFNIAHIANRRCDNLSSGQRTVVGLAKAALHNPDLVVLDEPTASLDPAVADRVRGVLETTTGPGAAALLITSHDMSEIERLADRVLFLLNGRVALSGSPAELVAARGADGLAELFIEMAAKNAGDDGWGVEA